MAQRPAKAIQRQQKTGAKPWTHASRSQAAMKAWATKHAGLHKLAYVPQGTPGKRRVVKVQPTTNPAGLGAVFTFASGRFRKTNRGWRKVPG